MAVPTAPTVTGATSLTLPEQVAWTITSTDADDGDITITVDWGTGTSTGSPGDEFTHSYPIPGRYPVTVTAATDAGSAATDVDVTVAPPDALRRGPCDPWITGSDLDCTIPDDVGYTADDLAAEATRWLFDATGGYWTGVCEALIRPYTDSRRCATRRWRTPADQIDLRNYVRGPVTVLGVYVNGTVISPDYYRVERQRFVIAQKGWDGDESPLLPWPLQDMDRPLGAENSWWFHIAVGEPPPDPLIRAAKRLACEMHLQLDGSDQCALPTNATSVSHNGVTVQLRQREPGQVGVQFIDTMIEQYGRSKPRRLHDPLAPDAAVYWFPAG